MLKLNSKSMDKRDGKMKEKYLPIGSVVILKNAEKKVMITGYLPLTSDKKSYDYSGCAFPEGLISSNQVAAFNHDQIEKIFHEGFSNEESVEFLRKVEETANKTEPVESKTVAVNRVSEPTQQPANRIDQVMNVADNPGQVPVQTPTPSPTQPQIRPFGY